MFICGYNNSQFIDFDQARQADTCNFLVSKRRGAKSNKYPKAIMGRYDFLRPSTARVVLSFWSFEATMQRAMLFGIYIMCFVTIWLITFTTWPSFACLCWCTVSVAVIFVLMIISLPFLSICTYKRRLNDFMGSLECSQMGAVTFVLSSILRLHSNLWSLDISNNKYIGIK